MLLTALICFVEQALQRYHPDLVKQEGKVFLGGVTQPHNLLLLRKNG